VAIFLAAGARVIDHISHGLALAFLAGTWRSDALISRGRQALDARPRWLGPLVHRVLAHFPEAPPDGLGPLTALLRADDGFRRAVFAEPRPRLRRWILPEPAMVPVAGAPASFATFPLPSEGDLAHALKLTTPELAWFADARHLNAATSVAALAHYRWQWVSKARGGHRLLEAPKFRLRGIQRWILRNVLAPIPPSPHAHGFVRGRDVRSFVQPHVGRTVVVRLDLEEFFASIRRARVAALFRRVGYPRAVANTLANLSTVSTPPHVLAIHPRERADLEQRFLTNQRLRDRHLPQGAPTSPALSNLIAWRLDCRLGALAEGFGATMTRYADDLAFSGDETFAQGLRFFLPRAGAIALEEGFRVNHRKTRVMRRGQRQELCGVVINEKPNVSRRERDRLRAVLFNVARFGLESQNRDGHRDFRRHLEGKVAWVAAVNEAAGEKLKASLG
jgi:retron-type reverse transcriptase